MKFRAFHFSMLTILLLLVVAVAACGSSSGNTEPTQPTATRRTAAPTRTPGAAAQPTQDPSNDSDANSEPDESEDETPGSSPRPTQDPSNDSDADESSLPLPPDGVFNVFGTTWFLAHDDTQTYLFCASGRWKHVKSGDVTTGSGTFEVQTDKLRLTNAGNDKITTYQMTWKAAARVLELKEANATMLLQYDGKSNCS